MTDREGELLSVIEIQQDMINRIRNDNWIEWNKAIHECRKFLMEQSRLNGGNTPRGRTAEYYARKIAKLFKK